MGYLGVVAIKPIEVVLVIRLEAGQLQKLALFRCLQCVLKEFIIMLVHWFIVITWWLTLKSVNLGLCVGLDTLRCSRDDFGL